MKKKTGKVVAKNIGNIEKYHKRQKRNYIISWVAEIAAAMILAVFFSLFFCKSVVIQEGSMEPTLKAGQKVLYDSATYSAFSPKRGDIIVFKVGDNANKSYHIKRIVGLPGETVQIVDGQILINQEILEDSHEFPRIQNPGLAAESIQIPEKQYFVLGDNRNNSEDSRHAGVGLVEEEYILGKLWFIATSFSDFGLLDS